MLLTLNPSFKSQSAFTLIEMMIVILIVGVLAAIATANYQIHVRKAQVMTIYQTLNDFRMPYQILLNEGAGVTGFSPSGLNMPMQTKYCQFSVTSPNVNGITDDAVVCQIQNLAYIQGEKLSLDRAADGSWHCRASSGISRNYLPIDCQ